MNKRKLHVPSLDNDGDLKYYKKRVAQYHSMLKDMKKYIVNTWSRWEVLQKDINNNPQAMYFHANYFRSHHFNEMKNIL